MIMLFKNLLATLGWSSQNISDKKQIMNTFIRICDEHSQLSIQFNDPRRSAELYTSSVIGIHPAERRVVLDELMPREGNLISSKAVECIIKVSSNQKFYQFKAMIKPIAGESPPCYLMEVPKILEESQKRQAFRVSISRIQSTSVLLNTNNREPLSGRIIDLSATGARVEITTPIARPFKKGDTIEKCVLTLPDKVRISCKAEIRHWENDRARGCTTVGLKFSTLSTTDQRMVAKFITEMQRKLLRVNNGQDS